METVIIDDREFHIIPLTRGQIKSLKEYGFSYFVCKPTLDQVHDAMDAAFELALTDDDRAFLDTRPVKDSFAIWKAILAETYGGGDDEGNSEATSNGGLTKSGSGTAESAEQAKQTDQSA